MECLALAALTREIRIMAAALELEEGNGVGSSLRVAFIDEDTHVHWKYVLEILCWYQRSVWVQLKYTRSSVLIYTVYCKPTGVEYCYASLFV